MTAAPWPRAILPQDRIPHDRRNETWDQLADAYRTLEPGDQFLGLYLAIRDGEGRGHLLVRIDGMVFRLPVGDDWQPVAPEAPGTAA